MKYVVDHLLSPCHEEAKRLECHNDTWKISKDHLWMRVLKNAKRKLLISFYEWLLMYTVIANYRQLVREVGHHDH